MKKSKSSKIKVGDGSSGLEPVKLRLLTKDQLLACAVLILILAFFAGIVSYKKSHHGSVPNGRQYTQLRINQLSSQTASGSTEDRLKSYDQLVVTKASAGDYQGAISAFQAREKISTTGLDYADYFYLAKYYEHIGDKASASAAIDKAATLVPPDNPAKGFSHADTESMLAEYKARLTP